MATKLMRQKMHGNVCQKRLFHGTVSVESAFGICAQNFDPRLSGKHGTNFGQGAYFARNASFSHKYTGASNSSRIMFLASVLVGEYSQGSSSYRRPPPKPDRKLDLYDSCVDNESDPSIFVVFDRVQCYPEYMIVYKMSN